VPSDSGPGPHGSTSREATIDTDSLLRVTREIIAKVPSCIAITVGRNGDANARVVNAKPLSDQLAVRFATDLRSGKSQEIERSGRLTLAYQYGPGNAYVTLVGHAVINNDVPARLANISALDRGGGANERPFRIMG
jgi:general stress protein 26